ncbi:MAG: hypothetical protein ACYDHO_08620, partial [Gaiellaceae bacterium]
ELADYDLPFSDLMAVRVGRERGDRLDGRPTLLLERTNGDTLRIASLQAGVICEIAERLADYELQSHATG